MKLPFLHILTHLLHHFSYLYLQFFLLMLNIFIKQLLHRVWGVLSWGMCFFMLSFSVSNSSFISVVFQKISIFNLCIFVFILILVG